jgi:membrane-bound lytic murein transglycosylase D
VTHLTIRTMSVLTRPSSLLAVLGASIIWMSLGLIPAASAEVGYRVQPVAFIAGAPEIDLPGTVLQDLLEDAELPDDEATDPVFISLLTEAEPTLSLRQRLTPEGLPLRYADLFKFLEQIPGISSEEPSPDESLYDIPLVRTPSVESHLRFFHTGMRDRFEMWLNRLSRYKPLVEKIFLEFDLPSDLVFLSLVESGFNPNAYSRARATGPWQFMKGTARVYGLRVDQYVDERRDPIKSTVAAARYLRDLYDLFGAWPLAMAAYNAGEGKVMRALHKTQAESFWGIIRSKYLKRETREYVPRFMAAMIIAKNRDRYGFSEEPTDVHEFEEVVVRRPVHLRMLADASGIPYTDLKQLNPELRRDITPPDDQEYLLKVPMGMKDTVQQKLEIMRPAKSPTVLVKKSKPQRETGSYRVQVGDSLWKIAKRFNITVQDLVDWNDLTGRRIKPGDLLSLAP